MKTNPMRNLEICVSPEMLHLYDITDRVVVVVDIFRATSCMVAGLGNGMHSIIPVENAAECFDYKKLGYVTAGERSGRKLEEMDLGNSPLEFISPAMEGRKLAMTTTNGTRAIEASKTASSVVVGAFLNITSLAEFLDAQEKGVLILCAGWKGKLNMEDTLFAGALAAKLNTFETDCDTVIMAQTLYGQVSGNLKSFMETSSHVRRLTRLGMENDIDFCLNEDVFDIVPILKGKELVVFEQHLKNGYKKKFSSEY